MKYLLFILFALTSVFAVAQRKSKSKEAQQTKPAPADTVKSQTTTPQVVETQTQKTSPAPTLQTALTQHFIRKYSLASQWNDFTVAKDALYDLIIENPGNDSLMFTLAYYYYENKEYAPTLLINQTLLNRNPKNVNFLEMAAVSAESLGVPDKALQYYETLYLLTNNVNTLYKIAFVQFDLKRYNESSTNIDILLGKPEVSTIKVYFNDAGNQAKEYVMKVAVLNLKGLLLEAKGDKVGARKAYTDALAMAPDFVLAKQNLAKLK
jgi:tetratricopeptide (TPR) repeat protein